MMCNSFSFLIQTLWLNHTLLHAEFNHIISCATANKLHLKQPEVSNLALEIGMGFVLNFRLSVQRYAELFPPCNYT